MIDQSRQKIVGAFVIGFAIVAGAYLANNFGQSSFTSPTNQPATALDAAPERILIAVADADNNGIEDWRDNFVDTNEIVLNTVNTEYEAPTTLTDQVGVNFFQSIVTSKGYGVVGRSEEQVISDTVNQIAQYGSDEIIDVRDIKISEDSSPESIRLYANAAAEAIILNNVSGLRYELELFQEALSNPRSKAAEDLKTLASVYLNTKNSTLEIPVPRLLIKQHLDLLNVYNAVYRGIDAMSKAENDPMLAMVRMKRYEDDIDGLALAMQNMYEAIEPYAAVFKRNDSALLFITYNPNIQ
jgi:hypothetical protein